MDSSLQFFAGIVLSLSVGGLGSGLNTWMNKANSPLPHSDSLATVQSSASVPIVDSEWDRVSSPVPSVPSSLPLPSGGGAYSTERTYGNSRTRMTNDTLAIANRDANSLLFFPSRSNERVHISPSSANANANVHTSATLVIDFCNGVPHNASFRNTEGVQIGIINRGAEVHLTGARRGEFLEAISPYWDNEGEYISSGKAWINVCWQ